MISLVSKEYFENLKKKHLVINKPAGSYPLLLSLPILS
jgi:hypothetical protein